MLNVTIQTGRMASTPELKVTRSGICHTRFRLAVDRDYTSDGERSADFLSFVAWRKTAEFIAKFFDKGDVITVKGRLEDDSWKDENGNSHYGMVVNVDQAWFGETKAAREDRKRRSGGQESYAYTDADIPPEFIQPYSGEV